jgi:hypothetical protein
MENFGTAIIYFFFARQVALVTKSTFLGVCVAFFGLTSTGAFACVFHPHLLIFCCQSLDWLLA